MGGSVGLIISNFDGGFGDDFFLMGLLWWLHDDFFFNGLAPVMIFFLNRFAPVMFFFIGGLGFKLTT